MQVRQKVSHKKTFLFLEQLILKHNAHDATLQIKTLPDGIDFYFAQRSHALRFIDFVDSVMSVRSKSSKQLVSADLKNNDYNYKFNYMVEIIPLASTISWRSQKCWRTILEQSQPVAVRSYWYDGEVVDPLSGQTAEFDSVKYWKTPFARLPLGNS